jgi:hypothetical protein
MEQVKPPHFSRILNLVHLPSTPTQRIWIPQSTTLATPCGPVESDDARKPTWQMRGVETCPHVLPTERDREKGEREKVSRGLFSKYYPIKCKTTNYLFVRLPPCCLPIRFHVNNSLFEFADSSHLFEKCIH